ncbi:Histamine H1 receptor [Manis javanica]|nr:Histamine H1 receptor [Manis javanica]
MAPVTPTWIQSICWRWYLWSFPAKRPGRKPEEHVEVLRRRPQDAPGWPFRSAGRGREVVGSVCSAVVTRQICEY